MREEKSRQTRKKLIDKGLEIICKEGMKNLSIRRVAKECGMSPKGPYNYFEDANDFMNEIKHKILRGMMKRIYSDEVMCEKDPLQRLLKLEREFYVYHEQYFRLFYQIFSKNPMTQYYIEEDGEIWQYVTDYPFILKEDEEWEKTLYKKMMLGALLEGIPYTVDKQSVDAAGHVQEILETGLSCFDGTITGGNQNDKTR